MWSLLLFFEMAVAVEIVDCRFFILLCGKESGREGRREEGDRATFKDNIGAASAIAPHPANLVPHPCVAGHPGPAVRPQDRHLVSRVHSGRAQ